MQKSGRMVEGMEYTQILRQEKCSQNSKKASVATAETIKEKTDIKQNGKEAGRWQAVYGHHEDLSFAISGFEQKGHMT